MTKRNRRSLPAARDRLRPVARRRVLLPGLVAAAVLLSTGAYLFQPWKLLVDVVVHEPLPDVVNRPGAAEDQRGQVPEVLATGRLVSHEHQTSGRARVLALADGSRVLRLERLTTSNGPDLRVWLTDADVLRGRAGWFVFDDGLHVDLGRLKGNFGSHNYFLPAHVDLDELRSVSIWCRRFHVSFGAAELELRP